jgi:hypothetical protein
VTIIDNKFELEEHQHAHREHVVYDVDVVDVIKKIYNECGY